jgi:hypothetical protein
VNKRGVARKSVWVIRVVCRVFSSFAATLREFASALSPPAIAAVGNSPTPASAAPNFFANSRRVAVNVQQPPSLRRVINSPREISCFLPGATKDDTATASSFAFAFYHRVLKLE